MSFPGQRLQLRLVERRETAEKPLSFLQILNKADQPLDKRWRLYFSLGLTPKEGETRVLKIIIDGLNKDSTVKISGFGTFKLKKKKSRIGRNPKSGKEYEIKSRKVVTFHPSSEVKKAINNEK